MDDVTRDKRAKSGVPLWTVRRRNVSDTEHWYADMFDWLLHMLVGAQMGLLCVEQILI